MRKGEKELNKIKEINNERKKKESIIKKWNWKAILEGKKSIKPRNERRKIEIKNIKTRRKKITVEEN